MALCTMLLTDTATHEHCLLCHRVPRRLLGKGWLEHWMIMTPYLMSWQVIVRCATMTAVPCSFEGAASTTRSSTACWHIAAWCAG